MRYGARRTLNALSYARKSFTMSSAAVAHDMKEFTEMAREVL